MKIILDHIDTSLDDYQQKQGDSKDVKVPGGGQAAGSVEVPGDDKGVKCLKPDTSFKGDDNNTNAKGLTTDTSAHHGD
ncbi:unnamed protein product [Rotaria sp. Silwood2]|nr:unnamed protein product [Rotaria sp. Silwood2]